MRSLHALACAGAIALLAGCASYNRGVIDELKSQPDGDRAARLLLLTLPDQREIPLRFVKVDPRLFYVGAGGRWWRQVCDGVRLGVLIEGNPGVAAVRCVDDARLKRRIFAQLRSPLVAWLPRWAGGGVLVELRLIPADP
ncbi:MAG: hypothetical protein AAF513_00405 [Pseudomonadota bacterium]